MPAGGNLTIRVEQPNPLEVQIDFIDEGVGIPEDMLEKIGQPFFTSKTGGHGLGLMMSRRIVEQHNGKMEIKSKLGAGTTFSLIFPTGSHGKAAQQENKEVIAK
ncbi:ATP-binding protein [Bacillus sp. EB01]|uniref:ATP-binding protein n=1 Tax=Bacillus sp. EB01 TaxID=1347086 RepID=UPI0005C63E91|nr:ATP-binding protein [Bacillus sp. EB01]